MAAAKKKVTKKKVAKKKAARKASGERGGARRNAGRKEGAATTRTRAIADKLAEEQGITPLEYMLQTLRETPDTLKVKFEAGQIDDKEYMTELIALRERRDWAAEKAAPYIHPRLASIEANLNLNKHEDWLDQLDGD